ncbi:prolipoprotein diacylglyceryl transferase [Candidatus Peregrinibacteria bacterium]|jgi:phosphatidylglycerol---prolipoprotein diacylglyceryl transferase|nr:prolipoprotein diacylglyceryl transferase [Candidatus Peregrinibacteria bacterium]MBT4147843.1 prolipoprotein diacylglyceryl transferase [Candidatus Peregrinibacteria bacterium]MBT4366184.1 prolipoprotein diacylglyceryl transferase [Candidatus Peregrinibacteria bacterium]MBT4455589.1 prolipoprotein diacylglyceryl transferase [Candidatus Peregrinibacteria bacterium]
MFVHEISSIAFSFGPVEVRWYGVMFAFGVLGYYFLTARLWKKEKWPMAHFDLAVGFLFFGLVIGARLGEVFFYHPEYYLSEPLRILRVWEGGLSSHGATIGLLVAYVLFWLWVRRGSGSSGSAGRIGFWKYVDLLVVCMPLVAGFVRIGNFFNSEIVGRASDLPWAVVFSLNGETFGRHPSQIYEAVLALGIFAFLFSSWVHRRGKDGRLEDWVKPGLFVFTFVGLYFLSRFGVEFFKEYQVVSDGVLTMGQWLSIVPVGIATIGMGWIFKRR